MKYATEKEMIEYCDKYPCKECPIAHKCEMFEYLFHYLPNQRKLKIDILDDNSKWREIQNNTGLSEECYYLQNIRMAGNEHGQLAPNTIYAELVQGDGTLVISATLEHILCAIRDRSLIVDRVTVQYEYKRGSLCSEVILNKYKTIK